MDSVRIFSAVHVRRGNKKEEGAGRSTHEKPTPGRQSAALLALIQSGSAIYCLGAFLFSAFMLFVLLSSAFGAGAPAISLPVGASKATEVPVLFSRPGMTDAHFSLVEFSAWGLPPEVSLLYYGGRVLTPITHAIIALAIYRLAMSAESPRPFGRSVRKALTLSAVTIALVGTATQLLQRLGTDLARSELLRDSDLYAGHIMATPVDWSPVFVGAAIGVLVIVFKAGERFQDEVDGLI